ncbi:hypothetical protein HMSSN139_63640 [Paenibacillus sp. HMSSN-139]|nr:hypothetical protein HMSSN139_63640 [Paenibacillus sp. HMSSN-139]
MSKTYVVIVETKDGKLRQVSLEALHAANLLREEGDRLAAVLLGHQIDDAAAELARYVDGQVLVLDHAELQAYQPELAFEAVIQALAALPDEPNVILLGHTAIGRDLAPQPCGSARLRADLRRYGRNQGRRRHFIYATALCRQSL